MQDEEGSQKGERKRLEAAMRRMQEEQQKKEIARKYMDDGAYERLMNIKATNPDLYDQVIGLLIALIQGRRLNGKLSEKEFVALMARATERHEPTISFKHK